MNSPSPHDDSDVSSEAESISSFSDAQLATSRKRKRTPLGQADAQSLKPIASSISTASRIKAKKNGLLSNQSGVKDSASAVLNGEESSTFADLDVAPWLVKSLETMAIKRPTGIQKGCIREIIQGRDCIGGSRTGSGKTVAFAVPIMQKWAEDAFGIFAVVLTPTRELATQIYEQFQAIGAPQSLKCVLITGGADQRKQALALSQRPHVVIATPGRLADHVLNSGEETICGLRRVRFVVFDEADRLLSTGRGSMLPDIETCLSVLPPSMERQTLLFTATVTVEVRALKSRPRANGRPEVHVCEVDIDASAIPDTLEQKYLQVPVTHREPYLHILLSTPANVQKSVIVFCNRRDTAKLIEYMLRRLEHRVTSLRGDLSQTERNANLARFRAGAARILVTTDVGARGLDIKGIDLVINYDIPRDPDDYIHRVGRAARAGRHGEAVTLVGQKDVELVLAIEARVRRKMTEYEEEGVSIEGRVIREGLKVVGEKKREALMAIEENRDVKGNRKRGMQKKAKV